MIRVVSSNTQIWNIHSVVSQITHAMINDENIVLDFIGEGPDVSETVLDTVILELANKYQYDTKRVNVVTANQVQKHNVFSIEKSAPLNLVNNAKKYAYGYTKDVKKHFGIFIGRIGCFLAGCCYGHDHFPIQLVESLGLFVIGIWCLKNLKKTNLVFAFFIPRHTSAA